MRISKAFKRTFETFVMWKINEAERRKEGRRQLLEKKRRKERADQLNLDKIAAEGRSSN